MFLILEILLFKKYLESAFLGDKTLVDTVVPTVNSMLTDADSTLVGNATFCFNFFKEIEE